MCINLAPIEEPLAEIYGRNTFLKVKSDYFSIGKVLFSFVQWTGNNQDGTSNVEKSIDCCLDLCKAIVFANDLLDGVLADQLAGVADDGYVWESPIGGIREREVAQRGLRNDGKAVARSFGLQPAKKGVCRFTAKQMPGTSADNGLIVPCKGKADAVITVPVENREKLREFGAGILLGIVGYMAGLYASSWGTLEQKREMQRAKNTGKQTEMKTDSESKGAERQKEIVCDCYWSVEKGSIVENFGKKGEGLLRMVVPRVSREDTPLVTDDKWQLADVIFYDKEIRNAPKELQEQIRELFTQASANISTGSIKNLPLKVGGTKNGHRQMFFSGR